MQGRRRRDHAGRRHFHEEGRRHARLRRSGQHLQSRALQVSRVNHMTYESMLAETVAFRGHNGDVGEAYYARPLGGGPWPGVVLIHHMPGWDWWIKEATRTLAYNGFATISPHLYFREGPGSPDDVGARVRAAGGVSDEQVMGDVRGCMNFL